MLDTAEDVFSDGRLGIGRDAGSPLGWSGNTVIVGNGVACVSGAARRGTVPWPRDGGLIGRTASKYCVPDLAAGVGVCATVAVGAITSSASTAEVALGSGVEPDDAGVSVGEAVGDLVAGADVEALFFFRGFGVGVGRTNNFFNLSPSVSFFSSVAFVMFTLSARAAAIINAKRNFLFTQRSLRQPANS